jgi:hypothetical protein
MTPLRIVGSWPRLLARVTVLALVDVSGMTPMMSGHGGTLGRRSMDTNYIYGMLYPDIFSTS